MGSAEADIDYLRRARDKDVSDTLTSIKKTLGCVKGTVEEFKKEIKEDLGGVKADVSGVKTDVALIKNNVEWLKTADIPWSRITFGSKWWMKWSVALVTISVIIISTVLLFRYETQNSFQEITSSISALTEKVSEYHGEQK